MTFEELAQRARTTERSHMIVVCPEGDRIKVETLVLRWDMDQWWSVVESSNVRPGVVMLISDLRHKSVGVYPPAEDTGGTRGE